MEPIRSLGGVRDVEYACPETGEVVMLPRLDANGRRWGLPLWSGGPTLGGRDWKPFVARLVRLDAEIGRVNGESEVRDATPERRRAALRYVVASFGRDPIPLDMVRRILAGEADDVVRTI